ncbi:hypothetical protein ACLOJK_022551, partial [Asimina triloba]
MYRHIDFSPIAITLVVGENWSILSATAMTPCPSYRAVSVVLAASPAPRHLHKASYAPVAAITSPQPSRKVTPTAVVATPTLAIWPPCKPTISATPAPRPPRKVAFFSAAATTAPRHPRNASSAAVIASPIPTTWPLQKLIVTAVTSAT